MSEQMIERFLSSIEYLFEEKSNLRKDTPQQTTTEDKTSSTNEKNFTLRFLINIDDKSCKLIL